MKHHLTRALLGVQTPSDGFTEEEKKIIRVLGSNTIADLYSKLPTNRMKAIVAMHFELGYDQETLGKIFEVRQEQIALDIKMAKTVLMGKAYRPHKKKGTIRVSELIKLCMALKEC